MMTNTMSNIFHRMSGILFNQAFHGSNIKIGNNNFGLTRMENIFEINETILKFIVPPEYSCSMYLAQYL